MTVREQVERTKAPFWGIGSMVPDYLHVQGHSVGL